jgi:hypothetical protein
MQFRFATPLGLALLLAPLLLPSRASAEDCTAGSADEKIACLARTITALETRVGELHRRLDAKADVKDAIKYYDRIALMNEDMRIYPRCLDNPGPNSRDISAVLVTSCAKTPAQTWMVAKPYHDIPGPAKQPASGATPAR